MSCDTKKIQIMINYSLIILVGVIPFVCGNLYYVVGDDYIMNYVARGTFGGGVNEHIPFLNIIIGKIWKCLYQLTNNTIDWMAVTYLLIIILCGFVCFWVFKRHIKNIWALLIALSLEVFCIGWLTFTSISYIIFLNGFLLLCEGNIISFNKKRCACIILSSLMIICSFCIRVNAFKSCVVLMLPILVAYAKNNYKKIAKVVIVIIGCVLLLSCINRFEYSSRDWVKYNKWNNARWQVLDYEIDSYEKNPELYKQIGFSENDYKGIDCICADNKVYSPEKLEYIIKNSKSRKSVNILKNLVKMIQMKELWVFVILFLLGMFFSKRKIVNLFIFSTTCAFVQYLFFIGRPLLRVIAVIFFVGQILTIYNLVRDGIDKTKYSKGFRYSVIAVTALIMFMAGFVLKQSYSLAKENREKQNDFSEVYKYINNHREKLFIMNGDDKLCYWSSVNIVDSKPNFENVESTCSYRLYSDNYYRHLSKYKLKKIDRLIVNVTQKNVYYIDWGNKTIKILEKYLEEHTGQKIIVESVKKYNNLEVTVYDISDGNAVNK